MKQKKLIFAIMAVLIPVVLLIFIFHFLYPGDTTFEFTVIDDESGFWVWDLKATLQDRVIRGYYQSSGGPVPFEFTHLEPGEYQLELNAPSYTGISLPVTLKRGRNVLPEPVRLRGYEIPGFHHFSVFIESEENDILLDLRPVNSEGLAIKNHPCLDLWIACRVYVQEKNGIPVLEPTLSGSETGKPLFQDVIPWEWDGSPENIYRYTARFKQTRIEKHNSPYRVYEYLVIIPDPRKITREVLDREIRPLLEIEDLSELRRQLDRRSDGRFIYYLHTKWNVPASP